MATTADIRNGLCLEHNNDLFFVVDFLHAQTGRGAAHVWTKLKNVRSGRTIEHTFSSGHKIKTARVERRPFTFLYKDTLGYNFMHAETYEQITIEEHMIEEPLFLKDGLPVEVIVHAETENILGVDLPQFVEMEVTYTEPGIKGDTATNASKPATLESGIEVYVPLFINQGDRIKVDTRTKSYSERVKK